MSFLDPAFALFLLIVFAGFSALLWCSDRCALGWLLLASLLFYSFRIPEHLWLLLGISGLAFAAGRLSQLRAAPGGSIILAAILALVLLPLLVFKYYGFALTLVPDWLLAPGAVTREAALGLSLPLGISFFTFQNIGYVADRWKGWKIRRISAQKYAIYIAFFPQLVAGPIVSARDFLPQLESRSFFYNRDFILGAFWLFSGYLKKAFLADSLAGVVDPVYANPDLASGAAVGLAVLAYAMQIYFDFSGYSDIAIGIGLWFGFRLPENFVHPYSADSFRDFWRRWHITLSRWLRDHLYIPMGGNRLGVGRMYFALMATMLLGGLWHGAHWNFVLWGAGHGLLLIVERWLPFERLVGMQRRVFRGLYRIFVLASIVLLWIPFRAGSEVDGFATTAKIFDALFAWESGAYREADLRLVAGVLFLLTIASLWGERLIAFWSRLALPWQGAALAVGAILLLIFSPGGGSFIYFVF